jgi:hypothetical protein
MVHGGASEMTSSSSAKDWGNPVQRAADGADVVEADS